MCVCVCVYIMRKWIPRPKLQPWRLARPARWGLPTQPRRGAAARDRLPVRGVRGPGPRESRSSADGRRTAGFPVGTGWTFMNRNMLHSQGGGGDLLAGQDLQVLRRIVALLLLRVLAFHQRPQLLRLPGVSAR